MLIGDLILAALTLAGQGTERPVLCVQVTQDARQGEAALTDHMLSVAMRARLARGSLEVVSCSAPAARRATWRMSVDLRGGETARVHLDGEDVSFDKTLDVRGQLPHQVLQLVTLTGAEAARPAVDALLAKLNLLEVPYEEPSPPAALDTAGSLEATAPPAATPGPVALGLRLGLGPQLETTPVQGLGYADLGVSGRWQALELVTSLGAVRIPEFHNQRFRAVSDEVDLALTLLWWWRDLALGGGLQGRLTTIQLRDVPEKIGPDPRVFWDIGGHLAAEFWPLRLWRLKIGVISRCWIWVAPNRFLVMGQELRTQSRVKLFAGPSLQLSLP